MSTTFAEESTMKVMDIIKDAPTERDMSESLCLISAFAISSLRGIHGDEVVQSFLDGAKADKIAITVLRGSVQ